MGTYHFPIHITEKKKQYEATVEHICYKRMGYRIKVNPTDRNSCHGKKKTWQLVTFLLFVWFDSSMKILRVNKR